MDWTPGQMSDDIEDRRGESYGGGPGFSFGGGGLGVVGVLVLVVASLITGHNFLGGLVSGGTGVENQQQSQSQPQSQSGPQGDPSRTAAEDRSAHLVSFVLDDAQQTWSRIFAAAGKPYRHAKLVLYRGATYSGCGTARSQTGPFYCPQDEKIYIDLNFWDELRQLRGDSADFAQSYVIAHELGHHIQKLLGIEGREQQALQSNAGAQSALSVDTELQADCFAGIWGHSTAQRKLIDQADVADALRAAAAVGDDHIAKMEGRAVSPDNFTHGTSAQREHWFETGLQTGNVNACDTYNGRMAP